MRDPRHGIRESSFSVFVSEQLQKNWALRPQLDWIVDFSGNIAIDRVLRFENLQEDARSLFDEINLTLDTVPHELNSGLPVASYRDAYDAKTKRMVANRYDREIEIFGYCF